MKRFQAWEDEYESSENEMKGVAYTTIAAISLLFFLTVSTFLLLI